MSSFGVMLEVENREKLHNLKKENLLRHVYALAFYLADLIRIYYNLQVNSIPTDTVIQTKLEKAHASLIFIRKFVND